MVIKSSVYSVYLYDFSVEDSILIPYFEMVCEDLGWSMIEVLRLLRLLRSRSECSEGLP